MLLAFPVGLLALALLSTPSDVSAAPGVDECQAASPRIELSPSPSRGQAPVVCISPGVSTTFRFDSVIVPASVKIQERERFEDVTPGQKNLFVVPLENVVAGKHFELEVCFADGAVPECASFDLIVHPGLGMQEVKVLRQPRAAGHYKQVAEEAEAEVQQCRAEVRQLRAERGGPDGLGGAIASGLVSGQGGIAVKELSEDVTAKEGNALVNERVFSYRASERVAVEAYFQNPGTAPWMAAGAVLRGPKGEVLKPVLLWQPDPIRPAAPGEASDRGRVVVEVLATEKEARGTYTLILWDADRQRTVTLGNVSFP
ncbi:MAG TPA: DUF2381 family protein [Archangium sp.]|uniref:DUF2381 family protein n=1 Tax=Archangium sp. TaxID=1872627 RepID=UPI002E30F36A|nr:DUF2381 family protein [Archangium sp.]HEX5749843.1 DUF2381 family protein [Archangium sp.]